MSRHRPRGHQALTALIAATAVACGSADGGTTPPSPSEAAGDTLTIGYAAAITGDLAPYDSPAGVQCAVELLNERDGLLGSRVEVIVKDMKSDAIVSGTVARELIHAGADILIAPSSDDTAIPVAEAAAEVGLAAISVGSTQPTFPLRTAGTGFLTAYADNVGAAASAQYAYDQGWRTAYLMLSHDYAVYTLNVPRWFEETFEHLGGTVVGESSYNFGLSDYSPQVTQIAALAEPPDVIFAAMIAPDNGVFIRQLRAAGVTTPVLGPDAFDDPGLVEVAGDAAEGVVFSTHGFPDPGSTLANFYEECEDRGYQIESIFFGLAGETIALIEAAVNAANSTDPGDIREALQGLENAPGVVADSITYAGTKGIPDKPVAIVEVRNGQPHLVGPVNPTYVPDAD